MRTIRIPALLASLIVCLSLIAAAPPEEEAQLTLGEFAVLIASRPNPGETGDPASLKPEAAAQLLERAGIRIQNRLSDPLTEDQAADLFRQFGITLQASDGSGLLDAERAALLVSTFGPVIQAQFDGSSKGLAVRASGPATGVGGGTLISLEDLTPADCQMLPRPPGPCTGPQSVCNPCMDCCKNQLGLTGKICGRLCQKKNLVTSPTEPTP